MKGIEADPIEAAVALLQQGWTQHANARDNEQRPVSALDPNACKWCLYGAIMRACDGRIADVRDIIDYLKTVDPKIYDIVVWNDASSRTREDVLALLARH